MKSHAAILRMRRYQPYIEMRLGDGDASMGTIAQELVPRYLKDRRASWSEFGYCLLTLGFVGMLLLSTYVIWTILFPFTIAMVHGLHEVGNCHCGGLLVAVACVVIGFWLADWWENR